MTPEKLIATLIASSPGYAVDLFGCLSVYRLEDGRFAGHENDPLRVSDDRETLHATPHEAATEFERIRKLRQLGYDFEVDASEPT